MSTTEMTDEEYARKRALFEEAQGFKDELEAEAIRRDEAYVLDAWYYHSRYKWAFFTLDEAVNRAQDDCSPVGITGPGGVQYDTFTGKRLTTAEVPA
jgi:hypothetical protein